MNLIESLLSVALSAAPWLLLGLFVAGLVKAYLPERLLQRWLGGAGVSGVLRASIIGMPLPLCSCGAIPTAMALHRGGAGRGPTTAFLISTPGVGVDSIFLTSALLGPVMALLRMAGALVTAIVTGILVGLTSKTPAPVVTAPATGCCASQGCGASTPAEPGGLRAGLRYAFSDLLDDFSVWIFVGLLLAGVLMVWASPQALASFSGPWALALMALVGIPLYVCASAATPIAAGLLLAGLSPGMALVFLLAGPITSLATLAVFRRELGTRALLIYMASVFTVTVALGWLVDATLTLTGFDPVSQAGQVQELLPHGVEWLALVMLVFFALRPLRHRALGF
ncbi:SO_0444 family Cu/Zn efflux transporter [Vreelandella malpeensis]|uniref:SO_0444 family Cu/Zn efflux transporter n=1 Tax=Vreelandella malpeensis TaxID=1172368 RepID=A0ABS8DNN3_9GAMM|nr:SO_0444 family Cu/Zn efflux transporter [Halomonas malpeensis]MCB8887912.1 SO_0444 family Cu/Zn efflux transporter [Halomonas malpeensis]